MTLHVFAADILAADAVDQRDATLPTHTLLLLPGQRLAVEVEIRFVEFVGKLQCGADHHMHAGPQLEIIQRRFLPERVESGEEAWLMHDRVAETAAEIQRLHGSRGGRVVSVLPGVDPSVQVNIGEHGAQVGVIRRVIGLHRIARGHVVPMVRRDARLHVKETLGLRMGILVIGRKMRVLQLLGDHLDIRLTDWRVMVFPVVGLVRQIQTVLFDVHDIGRRRSRISVNGDADQVWTAGRVHGAKRAGERGLVFGLVDGSQLVFDGGESGRVDGIDVKETMVQSARLDGWAIILFKDVADLVFRILGELVEGTIPGTVVGKTVHVDPRAVDEAEQVLRRAGHGGERCRIDTRNQRIRSVVHGFTLSIFGDNIVYSNRIFGWNARWNTERRTSFAGVWPAK